MWSAVEKVRQRLRRATEVLEKAGIPYAVVGGNAVAAWVGEVDEAATRNTPDVEILLRRADLERAKEPFAAAGFLYRHSSGIDMFLDGPGAKARDAVHILFAGERVRPEYALAAPDVDYSAAKASFRVVNLDALVRIELTAFLTKNRLHLRDLIDVGLVDASWLERLPPDLGIRLQHLFDTPDG